LLFIVFLALTVFLAKGTLFPGWIGLIVVFGFWLHYFSRDPVMAFMFALTVFMNIGLLMKHRSFGLPSGFEYKWLFLILALVTGFAPKLRSVSFRGDKQFLTILILCILLSAWQILSNLLIHLNLSIPSLIVSVWRYFLQIFGIYTLIVAYRVVQVDARKVFYCILSVSFVILLMFFITILFKVDLVRVDRDIRLEEFTYERIYFLNAGFATWITFFLFLTFLFHKKELRSVVITVTGIMAIFFIFLTLTRLSILGLFGTMLILYMIVNRLGSFSWRGLVNAFFAFMALLFIAQVSFKLLTPIFDTFYYTFLDLTGQSTLVGPTEGRSTYEWINLKPVLEKNWIWGTGYRDFYFSEEDYGDYGISDLPLFANLAIYGVFGLSIFIALYVVTLRYYFRFIGFLNKNLNRLIHQYPIGIFLLLIAGAELFCAIVFGLFQFSGVLNMPDGMGSLGFTIGIILGLSRKYYTSFPQVPPKAQSS
jgi:hypothetical protein